MAEPLTPPLPAIMEPQQTDPLAQLRDIHLPSEISNLPNAPGWWILSALVIALLVYGIFKLVQKRRANQYRREALMDLERINALFHQYQDASQYLADYSDLLKRVALTQYPREQVANLSGEQWVQFLDKSGATHEFSMGSGQVLIDMHYKPSSAQLIDQGALHNIASRWIKGHKNLSLPTKEALA